MNQEMLKRQVADAVTDFITPGEILGVGAGTTVHHLIEAIAEKSIHIKGLVVCSSEAKQLAQKHGFKVLTLAEVGQLELYIDGTDEVNDALCCLKGGGGAATLEKITASIASRFICIADESKLVTRLGKNAPVAIEVLQEARGSVARACIGLGGRPVYREGFITQHGHEIIDVYHLNLSEPIQLETRLNNMPGVVGHGLFAVNRPDLLLLSNQSGIRTLKPN
ncbi:MAG: ribose 5-phosphate isomerase A [Legionellales bacterium]|nr:ribose 5-phosphate isomerase A [Legionellales bacterium]|tara:strand:- start:6262 stop:6927 length:666 start_codon:yes stop_codon:yes gene_type:complete